MYYLSSEASVLYPAPPEPATTMQIVSFILDNATEATLSEEHVDICVKENPALEEKLSPLAHDIYEAFGMHTFSEQFLVLEEIRNAPPAFIYRLQEDLGIRAHVYRVAGKNMVVLSPEARDSLIAFADLNERRQKKSSQQAATSQADSIPLADPVIANVSALSGMPRYAVYFFNEQRQKIFDAIYKLQASPKIPIREKSLEGKRAELENTFALSVSTEYGPIPEEELVLQHLSQKSNSL